MWAMISLIELCSRSGFTRAPETWEYKVKEFPEVVLGRWSWILNTGHPAVHAFLELKGEILSMQIYMCAGTWIHTHIHPFFHLYKKIAMLSKTFSKNIEYTALYRVFLWAILRSISLNMFFQTLFSLLIGIIIIIVFKNALSQLGEKYPGIKPWKQNSSLLPFLGPLIGESEHARRSERTCSTSQPHFTRAPAPEAITWDCPVEDTLG